MNAIPYRMCACLLVYSEEVVGGAQANVGDLCLAGSWVELKEIILHELVDLHYGSFVTAAVAVVGSGEDRHDVALVRPVVPVHDELMGARDSCQVIGVVELLGDVLAEAVAGTSGRDTPTAAVIGVGPKQITDGALVGSLLHAVELANLVKRVNAGREATVEAEHLVLHDGGQGQEVEKLSELLPHVRVTVLAQALIVKTVPKLIEQMQSVHVVAVTIKSEGNLNLV